MNIWHDIDEKEITPECFTAVIEIPNYGFIPRTYADDKDPLDVLVLCSPEIYPMTLIKVRPIGVMQMIDNGAIDDKIIAVPVFEPTATDYNTVDDLPSHMFDEIMHFFSVYKQLENKQTNIKSLFGKEEAIKIIEQAIEDYKDMFK